MYQDNGHAYSMAPSTSLHISTTPTCIPVLGAMTWSCRMGELRGLFKVLFKDNGSVLDQNSLNLSKDS